MVSVICAIGGVNKLVDESNFATKWSQSLVSAGLRVVCCGGVSVAEVVVS